MPRYSEEVIDSVRDATDIVDIIGGYVPLKRRGKGYLGLCPFHMEKTPSFSVNREGQFFHCFGCGAGGDVFSFLQKYEELTFPEAMEMLADRAGIVLPQADYTPQQQERATEREQLLAINREAGKFYFKLLRSEEGRRAYDYFTGRGLSKETMQSFGLGYAGGRSGQLYHHLKDLGYDDGILRKSGLVSIDEERGGRDQFWNRAMFPIMDQRNRIIAFGGRVMGDALPKYINSPETPIFNKSQTIYGLQLAKKSRRDAFILCEGYMDVIALHQAGFDNAVASLGTSLTEGHAAVLRRYHTKVYISYDADGAGRKAALRAIPILRKAGIGCKVINMSPYKDPDELIVAEGREAYQKRIDDAENAFLFRVRMRQEEFDLSDPQGKTDFERSVADMLLEFDTRAERENYRDAVCRTFGISVEGMDGLIRREAMNPPRGSGRRSPDRAMPQMPPSRFEDESPGRRRHNIKKPEGEARAMQLFLSWMAAYPELFAQFDDYIGEEDFDTDDGGIMPRLASVLFTQLRENSTINRAKLIGAFETVEEQEAAAGVFAARAAGIDESEDVKRAARDVFLRIKRASLANRKNRLDPSDGEGYMRLFGEMKQLEELARQFNEEKA